MAVSKGETGMGTELSLGQPNHARQDTGVSFSRSRHSGHAMIPVASLDRMQITVAIADLVFDTWRQIGRRSPASAYRHSLTTCDSRARRIRKDVSSAAKNQDAARTWLPCRSPIPGSLAAAPAVHGALSQLLI